jgi:PAS domain S-box-containing protein
MRIFSYHIPLYLATVFTALVVCIISGGVVFYYVEKQRITDEKHDELSAIADLKIRQIESWLKERRNDANLVMQDRMFTAEFLRWHTGSAGPAFVRDFLMLANALNANRHYRDIVLTDRYGTLLLSLNKTFQTVSPETKDFILKALKGHEITFTGFYWCSECGRFHMDFVAPLTPFPGTDSPAFGAMLLRIDPYHFLYKIVQSWPTPSRTAETLLVRKDKNDVLFLNELRHRKGTAMKLRLSADRRDLPAAMAVMGRTGIVEGHDYRGVEVLADVKPVPGTRWFMVAKMDMSEVNAPVRNLLVVVLAFISVLTVLAAASTGWWWMRQHAVFYRNQYESEARYAALEKQFDYLTRYAHDIIILGDENQRIIEANYRAEETYGYSRKELLSLSFKDVRIPLLASELERDLQALQESDGLTYETLHRRKDGTIFPVEVSARAIKTEEGNRFQFIVRDITERKRAEEVLLQLNRTYRVLSKINEAVVRIRNRGELLKEACRIAVEDGGFLIAWIGLVNDQTRTIEPAAFSGATAEGFLAGLSISIDDPSYNIEPASAAVREGRLVICPDIERSGCVQPLREKELALGYRSAAGFPLIVGGSAAGVCVFYAAKPHFFNDDEVQLLTELVSDISYALEFFMRDEERRRAEEELRALNDQLEERVALRTSELGEANSELEAFSYSVSHDLKAPLRAIEGFSRIIIEDYSSVLDQETKRLLGLVKDNTKRMGRLIDDLLAFSRAGRRELSIEKIDMREMADSVWRDLVGQEQGRRFDFSLEPLADAEGDPSLIRQVWMNLLSNAIKFTSPRDTAVIGVSSRTEGNEIIYRVTDNGVGFDMAYADKLFGVFQRLHSADEFPGTGVGLALVQRIVTRHGGRVWAEGSPEGGAAFYFSLKTVPKDRREAG